MAGYDRGNPSAYYTSRKTANSNIDVCTALCLSKGCVSFAVGAGECLLYNAPTTDNVDLDTSSPYLFYDAGCRASSPSTSVILSSVSATAPHTESSSTESSVSKTISSSLISPSASASPSSSCWTALGSNIPFPDADNLIQSNFQNGYWDGWESSFQSGVTVGNDCPGYLGRPSGLLTVSGQYPGVAQTYKSYTLQAGIHYNVSLQVKFDSASQCRIEFSSRAGKYLLIDQTIFSSGQLPLDTWSPVSGSFVASVDDVNLSFYLYCDGDSAVLAHVSDFVLSKVSTEVYTTGMTATGPDLIVNSDFSGGSFAPYSISNTSDVTFSLSATQGFEGTPGLAAAFQAVNVTGDVVKQQIQVATFLTTSVKGQVYDVSFQFAMDSVPTPFVCSYNMAMQSGGNFIATIGNGVLDNLPVGPFLRIGAPVVSKGGTVTVVVAITRYNSVLEAGNFYIDNISMRPVS